MSNKVGRNDPCTCGSGKKYKQCCGLKQQSLFAKKVKATVLSSKSKTLMERTFGNGNGSATTVMQPPKPETEAGQDSKD